MRRRWAALLLVLAIAGTALLVRGLLSRSDEDAHTNRAGPQLEPTKKNGSTTLPNSLRHRDGFAEVLESDEADASGALLREPEHYWFGVAEDARTRAGEEGATVRIEQVGEDRLWPGSQTRARGVFVLAVPEDLEDGRNLRLVIETHDGRLGLRSIRLPKERSTDVGRILLRSVESLKGRCLTTRGDAIGGATLQLRAFGELRVDPGPVASTVVDKHGYFEFKRVPRGLYVLEGRIPKGAVILHAPVEVPHPGLLLVRPIPSADLTVSVRNSLGHAVSQVNVTVAIQGASAKLDPLGPAQILAPVSATTDSNGMAELGHLPAGRYRIRVRQGHDAYDFRVVHTGGEVHPTVVTIPADPRIRIRCFYENGDVAARVKLTLATPTGPDRAVTTEAGVITVNRGEPPTAHIIASDAAGEYEGMVAVGHEHLLEGQVNAELTLKPVAVEDGPGKEAKRMVPRFAIVKTPDGLPVRGARVIGGGKTVRTDKEGRAALGELPDDAEMRLVRYDLASGFPSSGKLGGISTYEFVWNRGREVRVLVTDSALGFRLDRGVRIGAQNRAWKMVAPGEHVAFWDADTAAPDTRLVIRARGYQPLELEAPPAGVEPIAYTAGLIREGDGDTGTLVLRVRKSGLPIVGARLQGNVTEGAGNAVGRTELVAITADSGSVILRGLATGRWWIKADAEFDGMGWGDIVIAPGLQEMSVELRRAPAHHGLVRDDRKRAVEGAEVTVRGVRGRVARTRRDGSFVLNHRRKTGNTIRLRASKAGYTTAYVDWVFRKGNWDRKPLVLRPTVTLGLSVRWSKGASGDIPGDLRFELTRTIGKRSEPIDTDVRIVGGRLVAHHVPQGHLRLEQIAGSAWVPTRVIIIDRSGRARRPTLTLYRGTTVRGRVTRAGKPSGWTMVSVRTQGHAPRIARADKNGFFEIRGIPPGRVAIEAHGQLPASRNRNANLLARSGETLDVVVDSEG